METLIVVAGYPENSVQHSGFVSNAGSDTTNCGLFSTSPCRTLDHLTTLWSNVTNIQLLPHNQVPVYDPGENETHLSPNFGVTIDGSHGACRDVVNWAT